MRAPRLLLLAALLPIAVATNAAAQPDDATRAAARTLGEAGLALFEKGDYRGALDKYEHALALVQAPTLGVRAARSLVMLGRLVEASERYRQVAGMLVDPGAPAGFKAAQTEAQAQAEAERAVLAKRLAVAEIILEGAPPNDVQLFIDDRPVAVATIGLKIPIDPGAHRFTVRRDSEVAVENVSFGEGASERVVLRLSPRTPPPAIGVGGPAGPPPIAPRAQGPDEGSGSPQRTIGLVAIGVGGASLLVGGVTYLLAFGKRSTLDASCPNRGCAADNPDLGSYNGLRTVSTITLVAGGVLAGVGVLAVIAAPSRPERRARALEPWIAAGSAGVRGSF